MIRSLPLVLLAALLLVAPVQAAAPLDYTRMVLEQARTIVAGSQSHDEKLAALSSLFGKFLDTDAMAREALGEHWAAFTPEQQKEFLVLFRQLLERTYVQKLLLFENPNFVYDRQRFAGNQAIVDTRIVTPRDDFDVTYQLIPAGDNWQTTAITVEDVSLTSNLGSQLNDLLKRMGVGDLLTLMRRKYGNSGGEAKT